jgi:hypothetical protein
MLARMRPVRRLVSCGEHAKRRVGRTKRKPAPIGCAASRRPVIQPARIVSIASFSFDILNGFCSTSAFLIV